MVTLILRSVSKLSKLSRSIYDFWHGLVTEKCLKTDLDLQRFTFHLMLWFSEGILVKLSSQTVGEWKFVIFLVKYCWNKPFAIKLLFTSFSKPVPVLFTRQWTCEGSNSFQYERFCTVLRLVLKEMELAYSNYCRKGYNAQKWTLRDLKEEDRKKS